jgi:hypothetical protein
MDGRTHALITIGHPPYSGALINVNNITLIHLFCDSEKIQDRDIGKHEPLDQPEVG